MGLDINALLYGRDFLMPCKITRITATVGLNGMSDYLATVIVDSEAFKINGHECPGGKPYAMVSAPPHTLELGNYPEEIEIDVDTLTLAGYVHNKKTVKTDSIGWRK